ncbi:MAG: TraK family protein [Methylobacter sp.]|nr:TraK family protein [Methylobacter sp.]
MSKNEMKKRFSEQLGEWVKEKKSRQRDKNLVAFLAVKADVQDALNEGYAVKTIWEYMVEKKRIECGYEAFLNHINRLIRRKGKGEIPGNIKNEQTSVTNTKEDPKQKKKEEPITPATAQKSAQIPGFKFNPIPNKEELY